MNEQLLAPVNIVRAPGSRTAASVVSVAGRVIALSSTVRPPLHLHRTSLDGGKRDRPLGASEREIGGPVPVLFRSLKKPREVDFEEQPQERSALWTERLGQMLQSFLRG